MSFTITRRALLGAAATIAAPSLVRAQAAEPVVLYTSNSAQSVDAVREVAERRRPPIRISTVTGGSAQLLRRIEAEAARPQADLFWSSSANTLGDFRRLFQPYRSPEAAAIPAALHEPENMWTASNIHIVVAMVNRNQLGRVAMPTRWPDLLDPAFRGKIIIADPNNSSTGYTILWGVEKMLGTEGLTRLARNLTVNPAAAAVLRAVGQGEFAVGLTFEANAYAYVAGGQREIQLVYPQDGTFMTPEFMTLIKDAPRGDAARRAYDLMISRDAQIGLLEAAFRRPSRNDIDVSRHVELPNMASIRIFPIDEDDAARQRTDFLARWRAILAAAN